MLFGSAEKEAQKAEVADHHMGEDKDFDERASEGKHSKSDDMDSEDDGVAHRRNRRLKRALVSEDKPSEDS